MNIQKGTFLILIFIFSLLTVSSAEAGVYSDELTKCVVESTSAEDQVRLLRWMFSLMSLHPEVSDMSSITPKQREKINKQTANLIAELITESCAEQAKKAIKYEGEKSIESSFNVLGQVAMRGLLSDPKVEAGMAEFGNYTDKEKFKALTSTD